MPGLKLIDNPGQAFSLGATWGTPSVDSSGTTEFAWFINNTALPLYVGDIVCIDPTGTMVNQPTTATLSMAIGTVGAPALFNAYPAVENIAGANVNNTFPTIVGAAGGTGISDLATGDGTPQPNPTSAWSVGLNMGFTNGSSTVTYASASQADLGKFIYTPYNASTNANPQVFVIVSVVTNTSYTVAAAPGTSFASTFQGTTGTFSVTMGRDFTAHGPGWLPPAGWSNTSAFAPGIVVPVVTKGMGRVNINAAATTVAGDLILGTNASFVGTRVAQGAATAAQIGLFIAVPTEAYAQRDTTLTTAGITGHDSVRAIIGKF